MRTGRIAFGLVALAPFGAGSASAQESSYRVGEKVELMISAGHWQRCTVIDPGSSESVMRMRCDTYSSPAKSPAAGRAQAAPAASGYRIGQPVELEASGHWVPCTVSLTDPALRVRRTAYRALSRAAGEYIVHNEVTGLRPATGGIGPAAPAKAVAPSPRSAAPAGTLRTGEYACYGSGGRIMAGPRFKERGQGAIASVTARRTARAASAAQSSPSRAGILAGRPGGNSTPPAFLLARRPPASCGADASSGGGAGWRPS